METTAPKPAILTVTELKHEIMKLSYLKEKQEEQLKQDLKELYFSIKPSTLIRQTVMEVGEDKEVKQTIINKGIEFGSNFILDKFFIRKNMGIKGYLLNIAIKKGLAMFLTRRSQKAVENTVENPATDIA